MPFGATQGKPAYRRKVKSTGLPDKVGMQTPRKTRHYGRATSTDPAEKGCSMLRPYNGKEAGPRWGVRAMVYFEF